LTNPLPEALGIVRSLSPNLHLLTCPDSPDWTVDLTEFRKSVFGTSFETARISPGKTLERGVRGMLGKFQICTVILDYQPIRG